MGSFPDSDDAQEALDQPDVTNDSSDIQHGDNDNSTKMPLPSGTNHDAGKIKTFTENWVSKQRFFVLILTTA